MYNLNNQFGAGFERYVGLILSKLNTAGRCRIIPEVPYSIRKGEGHNRTSDWIVIDDSSIAFIECKTQRQKTDYKRHTTFGKIEDNVVNRVADSIVQVYKSHNDYRHNLIPEIPFDESKQFVPIVIFLEDGMYVDINGIIKNSVKEKLSVIGIEPTVVDDFPFHICSVDDFEYNVQLMFHLGFTAYFSKKKRGELTQDFEVNFPYVDYFSSDFQELFILPNK